MYYYFSYILILLLPQQYLAQDKIDSLTDKNNKNVVEELFKKINEISDQSFSNASHGARVEILLNIEEKLKKSAKSLGKKGEKYVTFIMKGIKERALQNILDNNISKTQIETVAKIKKVTEFDESNNTLNDDDIMQISNETYNGIERIDVSSSKPEKKIPKRGNETNTIKQNVYSVSNEDFRRMNIFSEGNDEEDDRGNSLIRETNAERVTQSLTPRYECESSLDDICLNIKEMKQLKCHFDDSFVPIEKLCDGVTNCVDKTDEKLCTSQVAERIQNANQIIRQIDESFQLGCFSYITKDSIMTTQIIILHSTLQAQQEFVEKYKHFNRSLISNSELKSEDTLKRAINEISFIISTLALALDAEICSHRDKTGSEFSARKFNDLLIEDFDKIIDEIQWSPKSCICKEDRCENITICTDACKRLCWQKHSLTQWGCPSINETETVPMSVICDGKFDCYDQSDEKDCVTGTTYAKFEAHKIFKDILTSLTIKGTSKEYAFIRNMFLSLHNTIEDLQKFAMASRPDLKTIRMLRNKCFSTLSSIYSETFTKSSFLYQKSEIYVYLMSLNENLVNALKHSHTGNKRMLENDGCYCRNGRCSMPICSDDCQRSCIAEPWLTRFYCKYSSKSVPLDDICNGKPDCPWEDDEANCEKEICRRHHLSVIRHSLQKIGIKQKGTSMGELLTTWKTKVSSTLLIAENNDKPNPKTIKNIIKYILNDLVITYGTLKDYKRNNEYALKEFMNIARFIMQFLRSCGL